MLNKTTYIKLSQMKKGGAESSLFDARLLKMAAPYVSHSPRGDAVVRRRTPLALNTLG